MRSSLVPPAKNTVIIAAVETADGILQAHPLSKTRLLLKAPKVLAKLCLIYIGFVSQPEEYEYRLSMDRT